MIMVSINSAARRWYIAAVAVLVFCAPIFGWWAFDRSLPTTFLGLKEAHQDGRIVMIVQSVKRTRACDTEVVARYIESPVGARMYLQPVSLTREQMRRIEADTPGEVRQLIDIPVAKLAPPGDWSYTVSLEFVCNPLHTIWPIRDTYSFKFPVKH